MRNSDYGWQAIHRCSFQSVCCRMVNSFFLFALIISSRNCNFKGSWESPQTMPPAPWPPSPSTSSHLPLLFMKITSSIVSWPIAFLTKVVLLINVGFFLSSRCENDKRTTERSTFQLAKVIFERPLIWSIVLSWLQ